MHQNLIPSRNFGRATLLCLLLTLGFLRPAAAQTAPDTARVRYSEDTVTEPGAPPTPLGEAYSKLVRLQTEEQSIWKLGLNNFNGIFEDLADSTSYYQRYGVYLIYERKLRPNVSVMAELSPDFTRYRRTISEPLRKGFSVRSQVAGRYYYNLSRRIRKGKSASNFSANYLSLAVSTGYGRRSHETPFHYYNTSKPFVRADMAVLYGLQRRLGRYGFIDFNFGFTTRLVPKVDPFGFTTTLRIGLALSQ